MTMPKRDYNFDIERLSEAVNGLQKCLECVICLQLMTAPVKTRCGHSFCQRCIGKVLHRKAPCPLCNNIITKRSISKDDHLESCIQNFHRLTIAIQTDTHIDIQSYLKQPRDTRESYLNASCSQSNVSDKRKPTKRQSILSKPSTSKADVPSTSQQTVIDCDNPRYDTNSLIQPLDPTSSNLTGAHLPPTNEIDNTLSDRPDVKVRTWIHSLIGEPDIVVKNIDDEETPLNEENASEFQANKDTKKSRSSDARQSDPDAGESKFKEIHTGVREKDDKRSADAKKPDIEESKDDRRVDSLPTTSRATHAVTNVPFSVDTSWTRVREVAKEMRGKKRRKRKLNVNIVKVKRKNIEENAEQSIETTTLTTTPKSGSGPRIIEDIPITVSLSKYKMHNKKATYYESCTKAASNHPQESNSCEQDLSDAMSRVESANEEAARNLEKSFANDKVDFSTSDANYQSANVTLTEDDQLHIRNLNSEQMREIIGFQGYPPQKQTDDANVPGRNRHLLEEMEQDEESEEDTGNMTKEFSSPSHRQRLIVLTPEKLNESVSLQRKANRDGGTPTSATKIANPTSCSPAENPAPPVNNSTERNTMLTPGKEAVVPLLRLETPKPRLSLKRTLERPLESPLFSRVSLMERLSSNERHAKSSKGHRSVDSSVSKDDPSIDKVASVRRDLGSHIVDENRPPTVQPTTAATASSKNTLAFESNDGNVGETVRQDGRPSVEPTESRDTGNRAPEDRGCGFIPIKFTQLGTMIGRRRVKYYYRGATKREQRFPASVRTLSVYNMQQLTSNSEIQRRVGNMSPRSFVLSPINDTQSTIVTVLENVHADKSVANPDVTVLETTRPTFSIPASSTPKRNANRARNLDCAEATNANRPSIAEKTPPSPRTPRTDQNATQNRSSHTANSIKLLSPDKDSQLQFLTIDSPVTQYSRSASSTRLIQSQLQEGGNSAFVKGNNLAETRDSQRVANTRGLSSDNSSLQKAKKRKRARAIATSNETFDRGSDVDHDSNDSAVSVNSRSSMIQDDMCNKEIHKSPDKKTHKSQDETSSHKKAGKKRRLSSSYDPDNEVIFSDPNERAKTREKKFKRIISISDSDTESESSARATKKSNRNKSGDRCDQRNASLTTSTLTRRKGSSREAVDEDLRIRSIVDKWTNEHSAGQKRSIEGATSTQDTVKLTREGKQSSASTNFSQSQRRGNAKLSGKNTDSDLFESNSIFNPEGLELLTLQQPSGKSKSPDSMDPFNDIINKVMLIDRSQQNNPDACRSTGGAAPRTNGDDETGQRDENVCDLLQDNFDEVIANIELPQSEDVISGHNPDRNLNRTLTGQNASSCPAMTNEPRGAPTRHNPMVPASSTVDIFESCGYTAAGKGAKKTQPSGTSGNSDKENTVSQQRKHDHAEEDRRDKKNVGVRSPDGKAADRERRLASKNNVPPEKRGSFDRVAELTGGRSSSRTEEINGPAGSPSHPRESNDESSAKERSSEYDTIVNITLQQARLKMFEEDLFGAAPAREVTAEKRSPRDNSLAEEQRTPRKRKIAAHERNAASQEHSADEDDIVENTPETKMRKSGNSSKTVGSNPRRNVAALNLSPIPKLSEFPNSTSPRDRATSKSRRAETPVGRPNLMRPLYQSTPKVTSNSATSIRPDSVFTTSGKGQLTTTSGGASAVISSSKRQTIEVGNMLGNACRPSNQSKLRFVCSGLLKDQIATVQRFARLHNVDCVKQFDSTVTHVIVNTSGEENAAQSTLKYLQGIAHRKWIVSYKWIEDCFNERRLLPEDAYEATTQSTDINASGPRNSRLSDRGLFEGFTFLCVGPYDNVSLSQYQDMLRATGATVVDSLQALAAERKGLKGVVIQSDTQENATIEYWYRNARAAPILIDWIVECIGHYRLIVLSCVQVLSAQDYMAIGYPQDIIGDEAYTDTSD